MRKPEGKHLVIGTLMRLVWEINGELFVFRRAWREGFWFDGFFVGCSETDFEGGLREKGLFFGGLGVVGLCGR